MNAFKKVIHTLAVTSAILYVGSPLSAAAAPLDLANKPLFTGQSVPPLAMLIMGRDHKLYYEAYNDASDLTGDGNVDIGYQPSKITYFGYFDSFKCYDYNTNRFEPSGPNTDKKCTGKWSGDFLNYLTTSRMDAIRKVFYGGYRSTDTTTETVLERAYIPQDAHSWGKEYTSTTVDGYDISKYTPLAQPSAGKRHLFGNTTLVSGPPQGVPLLRVLQNNSARVWEWASKEGPVLDISLGLPTDYTVRVLVCKSSLLEENCQQYGSNNKPVGQLQQYGENDSMMFSLLTGSYAKNKSGGVLRKTMGSIKDEINPSTGSFTTTNGIIQTINKLAIVQFRDLLYNYAPGWPGAWITDRQMPETVQPNWGNPIAEMMYEGSRYFAGKKTPTAAFSIAATGTPDAGLGLPLPAWDDPYAAGKFPHCSKPVEVVISDINPSFDTDQLPGVDSNFGSFTGDITGLNVTSEADKISANEPDVTGLHFIGQSGSIFDYAPTAKSVTSLGNIRGIAPEAASREGGYYSASVAYFGHRTDLSPVTGDQKLDVFTVPLASPLPKIEIPINGKKITVVPFAKTVGGCAGTLNTNPNKGAYQPTNQIVDFYAQSIDSNQGSFRINFEDVEQGADHDMDAIAQYQYKVNPDNSVTITLTSQYASGCLIQHMGYAISGTAADGPYLEIRDSDTAAGTDVDYFLDTPPGQAPNGTGWQDRKDLPQTTSRTFTIGANATAATLLKDPLWYAAKWGGYQESITNRNDLPDLTKEWDADSNGTPDNYFLVTNALKLKQQLETAFSLIAARTGSVSAPALNAGSLRKGSHLFQARFTTDGWAGGLISYPINTDGTLGTPDWDAGDVLDTQNFDTGRRIITYKPSAKKGIPFRWPSNPTSPTATEFDQAIQSDILAAKLPSGVDYTLGNRRLQYLRGRTDLGGFRDRVGGVLGDIINSAPDVVGAPDALYPDAWRDVLSSTTGGETAYSAFIAAQQARKQVVYVGANDGMLHAFDAGTFNASTNTSTPGSGTELFAYLPSVLFNKLTALTDPKYPHAYYVDGSPTILDAFFGGAWHTMLTGGLRAGGQGIYALDITTPPASADTESSMASKVLWEFTDGTGYTAAECATTVANRKCDKDLGFTYSQPNIVRMHNGVWAVVFGNGYNNNATDGNASTTGNAVLYVVNAQTGELISKIDTTKGSAQDPLGATSSRPNGLATVAPVDIDGDFIVDYIYAGDLFGNLWKFDVTSGSPSSWTFAYGTSAAPVPLFTAKAADGKPQAITTRPEVGRHPTDPKGIMVYFGTGKYIESNDNLQTGQTTQTFYGIWDKGGTTPPSYSRTTNLLKQQVSKELTQTFGSNTVDIRITTNNQINWGPGADTSIGGPHLGWYIDLINIDAGNTNNFGERQVTDSILRNGRIIFTTLIPSSDACDYGGKGWFMELDAANGGRLSFSPLDLNGDKVFNSFDYADTNADGKGDAVVSGRGLSGVSGTPGILSTSQNLEHIYVNTANDDKPEIFTGNGERDLGRQSWRELH